METTISINSIAGFTKVYYVVFDDNINNGLKVKRSDNGEVIDIFNDLSWIPFDATSVDLKYNTKLGIISKGLSEAEITIKKNILTTNELIELDTLKSKFFIWLLVSESGNYIVSLKNNNLPLYTINSEESFTFELKMKTDISVINQEYINHLQIAENPIDLCESGMFEITKIAVTKYIGHNAVYNNDGYLTDIFPIGGGRIDKEDWLGIVPTSAGYNITKINGGIRQTVTMNMSKSNFTEDLVSNVSQYKWIVVLYTSSGQLIMLRDCLVEQIVGTHNDTDNSLSFNFTQSSLNVDYVIPYYADLALPFISTKQLDCCEGFYGITTNDNITTLGDIWSCLLINFF